MVTRASTKTRGKTKKGSNISQRYAPKTYYAHQMHGKEMYDSIAEKIGEEQHKLRVYDSEIDRVERELAGLKMAREKVMRNLDTLHRRMVNNGNRNLSQRIGERRYRETNRMAHEIVRGKRRGWKY